MNRGVPASACYRSIVTKLLRTLRRMRKVLFGGGEEVNHIPQHLHLIAAGNDGLDPIMRLRRIYLTLG